MKGIRQFFSLFGSCKGSSSLIIICVIVIIVLISAFLTDIGYAAVENYKLARSAEQIAKTGARILNYGNEAAEKLIRSYAITKVGDLTSLDIKISDNNKEITVYVGKPFSYIFLNFFGKSGTKLKASVTARLSGVGSYKGVRPLALKSRKFTYGKEYILSNRQTDDDSFLYFTALDLDKVSYKTIIAYGYRKALNVGDGVMAQLGDMNGAIKSALDNCIKNCKHKPECTFDSSEDDCSRIIILPVVDEIDGSGSKAMNVSGFIAFFIEKCEIKSGYIFITGKFVKYAVMAEIYDGIEDYGLIGIKINR